MAASRSNTSILRFHILISIRHRGQTKIRPLTIFSPAEQEEDHIAAVRGPVVVALVGSTSKLLRRTHVPFTTTKVV